MTRRRTCRLRRVCTPLACGFLAIVHVGCRSESERSAVAQVPGAGGVTPPPALPAASVPGITTRRLWAGGYRDFYASSISPDGRYLSMIDWSTVDLAVRDLRTGVLHRLTHIERSEDKPYEDVGVSVFSRDGRRIVVGWQYAPDLQLRALDLETDRDGVPHAGEPRVLFHNPEYWPYYPFDWSPDGSVVLAKVYTSGNANQLALISTDGGADYRALESFDWREPTMAEFSPDGRYVAYDFPPDPDSADRDVFVVSLDGAHEARIVGGPGIDRLLGWQPDGSILFHSDRGGTPSVWRVPVSEGRAAAPPELVRADMWGVEPLGFAGDRFYYGVDANPERLYTAAVDLEAGRLTSEPMAVEDPARIRIRGWDWSPDGQYLAYSGSTPSSLGSTIGLRAIDGGEVRSIHIDLARTNRLRWDPDGESIVLFTRDSKARRGFYRIDLESGTYETILHTEWSPRGNFAISPDGRTLYYTRYGPSLGSDRLALVGRDLASGEEREIARPSLEGFGPVALSPEGTRLAVLYPGPTPGQVVLGTVPVTGGAFAGLRTLVAAENVPRIEWMPDGHSILYSSYEPQGDGEVRTWLAPVDGSEARPLELAAGQRFIVRVHPDGRRIAFMAGESRGEVWVMEGLGRTPAGIAGGEGSR